MTPPGFAREGERSVGVAAARRVGRFRQRAVVHLALHRQAAEGIGLALLGRNDRGRTDQHAAMGGFGGMSVYSASKAGLSHFTRIVRQDLKGLEVRVTNLEVGPVPTDLLANLTHPPAVKSFARFRRLGLMPNVPAERVGEAAVAAVRRGKRAVWLPRRAFLFGFLAGAPQRIAEPLIRDIR